MPSDNLHVKERGGKEWEITEIPTGLMDEFEKQAAAMYPGVALPWMHFILDTISSVCDMDKAVFQMTDIPAEMLDALEHAAAQCQYTRFSLFSELLQAAGGGNLVIGRGLTPESKPGESITAVITGIPIKSWESLEQCAHLLQERAGPLFFGEAQPSAIALLMVLFEQARQQGFGLDFRENVDNGARAVKDKVDARVRDLEQAVSPAKRAAASARPAGTRVKSGGRGRFGSAKRSTGDDK